MNAEHDRHTITINDEVFAMLRKKGCFGESYSDVIRRLIERDEKATSSKGEGQS